MTASHRPGPRPFPRPVDVPSVAKVVPADDRLAWAEETAAALDALATLSSSVLKLAYGNGLSYREISDRLGITLRETTAAAARGLRQLGEAR